MNAVFFMGRKIVAEGCAVKKRESRKMSCPSRRVENIQAATVIVSFEQNDY